MEDRKHRVVVWASVPGFRAQQPANALATLHGTAPKVGYVYHDGHTQS